VEERLEALQEAWNSFIIEFPTYPKISAHGGEESQRILFLCSSREMNPTELCSALFNTQILMQQMTFGEPPESASRSRFVIIYAADTPVGLQEVLTTQQRHTDAPIFVTNRLNINRTAHCVTECLTRLPLPREKAVGLETLSEAGLEGAFGPLPEVESLWRGALPAISLTEKDGAQVQAATSVQDFRAEYACRYVLSHYQENINRDKMAEMVNLSPGYFSNLFRSEVGMSFSDYLIQVRIENAKRLLRRFDLSVEAISKQCGFNSLAHFSRTFKDRCGLSPLKYRKSPNSQT
jgi:AraC-like DNA-binding protein